MSERNPFPLTQELIDDLMRDPSPEARTVTAVHVAATYQRDLSVRERSIAEDIFRVMVKDAETKVRVTLAEGLKTNGVIPPDIAVTLANDVNPTVATPILEFSNLLSDDDLLEIAANRPSSHQQAIARRAKVSENVSDQLVKHGNDKVVATLLSNQGANISLNAYGRILEDHGENAVIHNHMVNRQKLPITVAEKLVTLVSDELQRELIARHEVSQDVANGLLKEAREKATMALLRENTPNEDVVSLVSQLHANGRLTASIIVRAACLGDMDFLETALARLCDIPIANAYKLIHDAGELGLKSIIDKAGLPAECYPVLKVAVSVSGENDYDGRTRDREHFVENAIERVSSNVEDHVDSENLEYLLTKLQSFSGAEDR